MATQLCEICDKCNNLCFPIGEDDRCAVFARWNLCGCLWPRVRIFQDALGSFASLRGIFEKKNLSLVFSCWIQPVTKDNNAYEIVQTMALHQLHGINTQTFITRFPLNYLLSVIAIWVSNSVLGFWKLFHILIPSSFIANAGKNCFA